MRAKKQMQRLNREGAQGHGIKAEDESKSVMDQQVTDNGVTRSAKLSAVKRQSKKKTTVPRGERECSQKARYQLHN